MMSTESPEPVSIALGFEESLKELKREQTMGGRVWI